MQYDNRISYKLVSLQVRQRPQKMFFNLFDISKGMSAITFPLSNFNLLPSSAYLRGEGIPRVQSMSCINFAGGVRDSCLPPSLRPRHVA